MAARARQAQTLTLAGFLAKANDAQNRSDTSESGPSRLQAEEHQDAQTKESAYQHQHSEDEADRQMRALGEWFTLKFTEATLIDVVGIITGVVLVFVGIVAACIYDGQLQEMRHTNTLTQEALDGSGATEDKILAKMHRR